MIHVNCLRRLPLGKFVRMETVSGLSVVVWDFKDIHGFQRRAMFGARDGRYLSDCG